MTAYDRNKDGKFPPGQTECTCGRDHNQIESIAFDVLVSSRICPQNKTTFDACTIIQEVAEKCGWIFDPKEELKALRQYVADLDAVQDIPTTEDVNRQKVAELEELIRKIVDVSHDDYEVRKLLAENGFDE